MESFQDIEHFVKTLSAAIKKKIPTKVSQLTNDVGYKTTDTNTTYKLSKSGSTVTLTGSDGSTTSVTDSNTTYSSLKNPYSLDIQNNGTTVASYDGSTAKTANFTNATTSANGLMSAADKAKLDGIGAGSNVKSVNGKTGAVSLSKADVGLGNVDNTADSAKSVKYAASAGSANAVAWGNVSGKPSTYPPSSHTHPYLPTSGGTMTGQIKTSFKESVAVGSYQANATTIPNLVQELRYSSGCMGSVNISTGYNSIPIGWYNFIYIPHRSGGVNGSASGDNCNYGSLILIGMTMTNQAWIVEFQSEKIASYFSIRNTDTNTTYGLATSSADGLMSKSDKTKLDGIGAGSNVKSVNGKTGAVTLAKGDVGLGSVANYDQSKAIKSITRSGTTFTATALDGTKTTFTQQDNNTTYSIATTSADGLMSKSDKAKLNGISSGADVSPIKTVKVNGTALTPDSNKAVNVTVPTLANNATTTASGMALDARMGKTLSDQISSVKTGAIDQIVNLTAAGWTGDAAPYSQTVNVTGMTDELLCELFSACPKSATVAEREAYNEAFALVASGYAETADGSATFLVDEKPAIDIGVRIKSISKANAVSDQTSSDISNAVDAMSNTLEGRINSLWEKIYPVGSIYISANSTSPANLFGGTWEQLKDRFLLAAGDTYAAGSTGGEAQHTLTVDEMPAHTHPHTFYNDNFNNIGDDVSSEQKKTSPGLTFDVSLGKNAWNYQTGSAGGGAGHNNMPPYLAVYMWKRVS